VLSATSGAAELEQLNQGLQVVVIVSDMRMPGMSGSEFLAQSRAFAPDAERILIAGQTDLASAVAPINEGQIFHFLGKPCSAAEFIDAIEGALERQRACIGAHRRASRGGAATLAGGSLDRACESCGIDSGTGGRGLARGQGGSAIAEGGRFLSNETNANEQKERYGG
jgi:DNA-binding NtrC family response regulator